MGKKYLRFSLTRESDTKKAEQSYKNSCIIPKRQFSQIGKCQIAFLCLNIIIHVMQNWENNLRELRDFFHKIHIIAASPCPMDQKAFALLIDNVIADLQQIKNVFSVISWAKQVSKTYWNFLNFPTFVSSSRSSSVFEWL